MYTGLFLWCSKNRHFRQCITFRPNDLVHLCLCQHLQGAKWVNFAGCGL